MNLSMNLFVPFIKCLPSFHVMAQCHTKIKANHLTRRGRIIETGIRKHFEGSDFIILDTQNHAFYICVNDVD